MKKFSMFAISFMLFCAFVLSWNFISSVIAEKDDAISREPDMPAFARHNMSKEEFMLKRAEGIALKRGISKDQPFDPSLRPLAIKQMEKQEELVTRRPESQTKESLLMTWTQIGPAPIPNGQTAPTAAVSGRVISIAVHPTNPNIVYVGTAQGGLYRSTDGGTNWTPIMDSADSLAIGAIAIAPSQPETVYVGTGEPNFSLDSYFGVGIYRIENASTTAILNGPFGASSFAGRAIGEIIVHPTNPATIFVGSTSGVAGLRPTGSATPNRGVYRSTNATSASPTFTQLAYPFANQNLSARDLAIDPDNPDVLIVNVVANGGGIIRSTNALAATPTFTLVQTFMGTSTSDLTAEFAAVQPSAVSDATFYAATGNGGGRVLRSTNGGATWTQQIDNNFCGGQCFYDIAIAVDPTNANNVYLGGDPTIISAKSTNGGTTFTDNNAGVHVDTHALTVAPSDPNTIYLGTDGGIYKSINAGLTWTPLNNTQFHATQFMSIDVHPTDGNFSIGGTQDNGTNFYRPDATWTRADFGDGGYAVIDQNAPDTTNVRMYHTYFNATSLQGYGTVSSTPLASDGLWTFRGCQVAGTTVNGITCNGSINFYAPLERGPGNPNTIYYGSDRLYRSADNGVNHTVVSQNPIAAGVPISSIGISPQNDSVRIVGLNNGGIFGTSTGSTTLNDLDPTNTIPTFPINRTIVDPNNANIAWVTLSAFGVTNVWKTTNLSSTPDPAFVPTWTAAAGTGANVLPQVPVNAIVVDPMNSNRVYVGTDIGAYVTIDGGTNWFPFGTGLPRVAIFDIAITANRLIRIATHGRGMWQLAALPPTAATVAISGRVMSSSGSAIPKAIVYLTDENGNSRRAVTNSFGYYRFEELEAGQTYILGVSAKGYSFSAQVLTVNEDLEVNFVASP